MPIHNLGGGCYKWGNHGHKYCGKGARQKALKQMKAIFHSGYTGADINEEDIKEIASFDESLTIALNKYLAAKKKKAKIDQSRKKENQNGTDEVAQPDAGQAKKKKEPKPKTLHQLEDCSTDEQGEGF